MNIYVGNVDFAVGERELVSLFITYGDVDTIKIISDKVTGKNKGYCFITMPNDAEANAAINALNGTEFEGRNLVVKEAKPAEERTNDNNQRPYNQGTRREGGYNQREGGYTPRGGGYQNQQRSGNYQPRDGGYNPRGGGYQNQQRPGNYQPRDGNYQPRDNNNYRPRQDGDFNNYNPRREDNPGFRRPYTPYNNEGPRPEGGSRPRKPFVPRDQQPIQPRDNDQDRNNNDGSES